MQIIRLVSGGVPDRLLAFDGLPKQFLETNNGGMEVIEENKLPKSWRSYGKHYVLFFRMINAHKERWSEIESFVKRAVETSFRLTDRLYDMAMPMAKNCQSEITLAASDLKIIPIPVEFQDVVTTKKEEPKKVAKEYKCEICGKVFDTAQGLRMHVMKSHKPVAA